MRQVHLVPVEMLEIRGLMDPLEIGDLLDPLVQLDLQDRLVHLGPVVKRVHLDLAENQDPPGLLEVEVIYLLI